MAEKVFTDKGMKTLKKPAKGEAPIFHRDAGFPNFGARVSHTGRITFYLRQRPKAKGAPPAWVPCGVFGTGPGRVSLATAHKNARDALIVLSSGQSPAQVRAAAEAAAAAAAEADKAADERAAAGKVEVVIESFIERQLKGLRTGDDVARLLRREILPVWQGRGVDSIGKADVLALVEAVADRSPSTGRQLLVYLRRLLDFADRRGLVAGNVADRLRLSDAGARMPRPRERTLEPAEISAIWRASESAGYPFAGYVRLLLLLGCRRGELAGMLRTELDLVAGTWSLPSARVKNAQPRVIPLPKTAVEILRGLPEFAGPFVFSTTSGEKSISGFSKMKARLDREVEKMFPGVVRQAWDLHDFRRTVRTATSAMPIAETVRELMLGHAQHGIRPVYDKHKYQQEQRAGFELWADHLAGIIAVEPKAS